MGPAIVKPSKFKNDAVKMAATDLRRYFSFFSYTEMAAESPRVAYCDDLQFLILSDDGNDKYFGTFSWGVTKYCPLLLVILLLPDTLVDGAEENPAAIGK
jgi:hypothetical protein